MRFFHYSNYACIIVPTTAKKALFKSSSQRLKSILKKQHPKIKDAFKECIGLNFKTELPFTLLQSWAQTHTSVTVSAASLLPNQAASPPGNQVPLTGQIQRLMIDKIRQLHKQLLLKAMPHSPTKPASQTYLHLIF